VGHEIERDLKRYLDDAWAFQIVPKGCKWPEAQGAASWSFLLWVKADVTPEDAVAAYTLAEQTDEIRMRAYHQKNCDGVTAYKGAKMEKPCNEPGAHVLRPDLDAVLAGLRCDACARGSCDWHYSGACGCPNHKVAA